MRIHATKINMDQHGCLKDHLGQSVFVFESLANKQTMYLFLFLTKLEKTPNKRHLFCLHITSAAVPWIVLGFPL